MILPSKHLSQDRALLTVGAVVLQQLDRPMTISALWEKTVDFLRSRPDPITLRFDAFILTLDLLYLIDAVELVEGRIDKRIIS